MTGFDALLSEYEPTLDTFQVSVPTPSAAEPFQVLTFKAFRSGAEHESAREEATAVSKNCPLFGSDAEKLGPFKAIAHCLPRDMEAARRIAMLSVALKDPAIPFLSMVRVCANASLFGYLWSEYQAGQKTVYAKLVEVSIAEAKKNLPGSGDSSSEHSETSDVPQDS